MKVLVTGGSSLLLGGVAAALVARGDEVVCLQRRPATFPGSDQARQVLADVRDADAVGSALRGCDAVVHGAARVGVLGTWEDHRSVNVDGTVNVVTAAVRHGLERVVHVSSPSVAHGGEPLVGAPAGAPVVGRKRAHYAESKAIAERRAVELVGSASEGHTGIVVVRPHLVWGPGDTQLVGRIVERARSGRLALVGAGTALVDTTYVDDAIEAHLAALDAVGPGAICDGRAYVIASGEPRPIRELVAGICRAANVPFAPRSVPVPVALAIGSLVERVWPKVRETEPPLTRFLAEQLGTAHWFDPRPARDDLGWSARVGIDQGLVALADWFASGGGDPVRAG